MPPLVYLLARKTIPEGTPVFIPLPVEQTTYQEDMCVSDITVTVNIDHPCTGQLRLTLYGPGPHTRDANKLENTARAEPAVLFVGHSLADGGYAGDSGDGECSDDMGPTLSFSDAAVEGVWEAHGKGM